MDLHDGISNRRLETLIGNNGTARNIRLALRLFHFGCPAVYMDQGATTSTPTRCLPSQVASGIQPAHLRDPHGAQGDAAPRRGHLLGSHPRTFGSEFSRTARGSRFNSARGSDHGGTTPRGGCPCPSWAAHRAGAWSTARCPRALGSEAQGKVFSYRATMKTLMDMLGCEHDEFFPADDPFEDFFVANRRTLHHAAILLGSAALSTPRLLQVRGKTHDQEDISFDPDRPEVGDDDNPIDPYTGDNEMCLRPRRTFAPGSSSTTRSSGAPAPPTAVLPQQQGVSGSPTPANFAAASEPTATCNPRTSTGLGRPRAPR